MPVGRQAQRRRASRRANRGFTLIELGAVVVIIGILSVLAVVGYRKYVQHSKISEAQAMVSAIRIAQEDFKAERGTYASTPTEWCPSDGTNGKLKTQWNSRCPGWEQLPVHADGMMLFGYRTTGGPSGFTDRFGLGWVSWTGASLTVPWYEIQAQADLDGAGSPYTTLVGSSFTNQIFIGFEGQ